MNRIKKINKILIDTKAFSIPALRILGLTMLISIKKIIKKIPLNYESFSPAIRVVILMLIVT